MKRLFLFLLFPIVVFSQGYMTPPKTVTGTLSGTTRAISGATITVCAANASGIPCSPALTGTLFKDTALTQPLANPFTTDANGNYQFAVAATAATYTVTETAAGYSGYSYQITVSCGPSTCATTSQPNTWTAAQTFTTACVSNLMNMLFVNSTSCSAGTYSTVQGGLNALSAGGTLIVAPGTYTGPTTIPSNVTMKCFAPPMSNTVAQLYSLTTNNVTDQCKLTYSAQLTLTKVMNTTVEGFIFDFNQTGFGVSLISTAFTHWNYNTFRECGNTTTPCLQLLGQTTVGTATNTFDHNFINTNDAIGQYAVGIYIAGTGTVYTGTPATINKFFDTTVIGHVLYAVDSELNTDTCSFLGLAVFQNGSPPANAAVLAFNLNNPGIDQDANGSYYFDVNYTGPSNIQLIRAGVASGNVIFYTGAAINTFPGFITDVSVAPNANWNFKNNMLYQITPSTSAAFMSTGQLYMFGGSFPSQTWLDATGTQRWQNQLGGSNALLWNNGTKNNFGISNTSGGGISMDGASSGTFSDTPASAAGGTAVHPNVSGIYTMEMNAQDVNQGTQQTAAVTATTLTSAPASAVYQLNYTASISQAATTSSTLGPVNMICTDVLTGNVVTIVGTSSTGNTTGTGIGGTLSCAANSGTNIQYSIGYTSSGATPMGYKYTIRLTRVN